MVENYGRAPQFQGVPCNGTQTLKARIENEPKSNEISKDQCLESLQVDDFMGCKKTLQNQYEIKIFSVLEGDHL